VLISEKFEKGDWGGIVTGMGYSLIGCSPFLLEVGFCCQETLVMK